jgi:hypothetical protein
MTAATLLNLGADGEARIVQPGCTIRDAGSGPPSLCSEAGECGDGAGDGGDDAAGAADLHELYAEAVAATRDAVALAEAESARELEAMGERLRAEQGRLFRAVMAGVPEAVRAGAARGQRHAAVLQFGGSDKFGEFCYLYMIKGPYKPELREEMRAMGARPLLPRLRATLRAAGFGVHHAWQRATNENSLVVSW